MSDYDNVVTGSLKLKKKSGIAKKNKKEKTVEKPVVSEVLKKTPAQLAFEEIQKKRMDDKIVKSGVKSHKQKVEEFNNYLSSLPEHYDIPKDQDKRNKGIQEPLSHVFMLKGPRRIFDENLKIIHHVENAHKRAIRCTSFSPDNTMLADASFDGSCKIWSTINWKVSSTLEGHENEVKCVDWSAGGNLLATCGRDKAVWIWQLEEDDFECLAVLQEHTQDVKMVKWHPNDDILASCSYDNTIKLWKEWDDEWVCETTLLGHESTVWAIEFNSNGDKIVSCSEDKTIRLWTTDNSSSLSFKCLQIISGIHDRSIYSISWSPFNDKVVSCGGDNSICILEFDKDAQLKVTQKITFAHASDVNDVKWNPKGNYFISCGDDRKVKLWSSC